MKYIYQRIQSCSPRWPRWPNFSSWSNRSSEIIATRKHKAPLIWKIQENFYYIFGEWKKHVLHQCYLGLEKLRNTKHVFHLCTCLWILSVLSFGNTCNCHLFPKIALINIFWHSVLFLNTENNPNLWILCMMTAMANKAKAWWTLHTLITAPDKALFQPKITKIFLVSPQKHMLWYSLEALIKALLMSTHNMFSLIRKILPETPSYLELCLH